MCSGENKSRKRIADQSGSMHCHCPTWSSTNDDCDDEPQLWAVDIKENRAYKNEERVKQFLIEEQ